MYTNSTTRAQTQPTQSLQRLSHFEKIFQIYFTLALLTSPNYLLQLTNLITDLIILSTQGDTPYRNPVQPIGDKSENRLDYLIPIFLQLQN